MDLQKQFEEETGQGRYNTEGKKPEIINGSFNDAYVEWLEEKLVKNLTIPDVSVSLPDKEKIMNDYLKINNIETYEINNQIPMNHAMLINEIDKYIRFLNYER